MPTPSSPNAYPSAYNAYPGAPDGPPAGAVSTINLTGAYPRSSTTVTAGATSNLTSATFTPAAGEVLVVKVGTWGPAVTIRSVAGGALTWALRAEVPAVSGQAPAQLWVASVATATAMTVTATLANSSTSSAGQAALLVERWSGGRTGLATIASQTVGAVVTWGLFDYNGASSDSAPIYAAAASEDADPVVTSGRFGAYQASQVVSATGSQTYGVTAPTGMKASLVAVELIPLVSAPQLRPIASLADLFDAAVLDVADRWPSTYPLPSS